MRSAVSTFFGILLLTVTASICLAQVPNLTFGYRGPGDATAIAIGANGTLPLPATQAGSTTLVQFYITNAGGTPVEVSGASSSNPIISVFPASLTIPAQQTGVLSISFQPKAAGSVSSAMTFTAGANSNYSFNLSGAGIVPDIVMSYLLQPDGNQTPVTEGGEIAFRPTLVSQTSTATFVIANRGTGAGTVSAVSVSGGAFRLAGLPLLPASVAAGGTLQFSVVFAPPQNDSYLGSLQVTVAGVTVSLKLSGQGSSANYSYQVTQGTSTTTVAPNATIPFGQTPLNTPVAVTFQVQDTGNANGSVNSVTVVGSGFTISNLVPLPVTLTPGGSMSFTVTFNPAAPGPLAGRLVIDGVTFNLTGTGMGSLLTMSFTVGSSTSPLANNGTANFPNAVAGTTVEGVIDIENTGNAPATVNNISLSGRFFNVIAPPLPARIEPGNKLSLPVSFLPNALGVLTGTLGIDTQVITLRGIGSAPPNLPAYSFTGVGNTALPAEQPSVGLTLDAAYDTEITGSLRLTFTPDSFASDPAIQFASGGTSVNFRIPAKSKVAVFSTGANSVQFQTGTVAGTINITPSFLTGEVSITPPSPLVKTVQIAASAPVIKSLQVGTRSANSLELLISGYSTPRSLTQITLQFTGTAGANLQTTTLNLNAESAFSSWYQSAASQTVGSQFTASVTILVNGNISAIQSVSATAANAKGSSNASNTVSLQ